MSTPREHPKPHTSLPRAPRPGTATSTAQTTTPKQQTPTPPRRAIGPGPALPTPNQVRYRIKVHPARVKRYPGPRILGIFALTTPLALYALHGSGGFDALLFERDWIERRVETLPGFVQSGWEGWKGSWLRRRWRRQREERMASWRPWRATLLGDGVDDGFIPVTEAGAGESSLGPAIQNLVSKAAGVGAEGHSSSSSSSLLRPDENSVALDQRESGKEARRQRSWRDLFWSGLGK